MNNRVRELMLDMNTLKVGITEMAEMQRSIVNRIQGLYAKNICSMTLIVSKFLPLTNNEQVQLMFSNDEYKDSITTYLIINIKPACSTFCGDLCKILFTPQYMDSHGFPRR